MKNLILILLFVLSSCASLNKEKCVETDWTKKGQQDGQYGQGPDLFASYEKTCQGFGVNISETHYQAGYKKGLKSYCTYKAGYALGNTGEEPLAHCEDVSPTFKKGFDEGFRHFQVDSERKKAIARILETTKSEKCMADNDCSQTGICSGSKCRHNGATCFSNSECVVVGKCKKESTYVNSIKEMVSVNICKY